jgi:hypothetical protein
MTDTTKDAAKAAQAKPEELDAKDLDQAAGGWGRTPYYSYSSDASASYRASTSNNDSKS